MSGVDKLTVNNAKTYNRKLQGSSKSKAEPEAKEGEPAPKTIPTSQQSYDSKISHFANLIQVLEESGQYTPNEDDLKTITLQSKLSDLKAKNTALINTYTDYSNAKITRDQKLYDPVTGLCQTAKEVKQYIKSVFGATSQQYKQVSALEFNKIK